MKNLNLLLPPPQPQRTSNSNGYLNLVTALLSAEPIPVDQLEHQLALLLVSLDHRLIPTLLNTLYGSQSIRPSVQLALLHTAQALHRAVYHALLARVELLTKSYGTGCQARYHLTHLLDSLQTTPETTEPAVLVMNLAVHSGICKGAASLHHIRPSAGLERHFLNRLSILLQHLHTPSNQPQVERWALIWTVSQVLPSLPSLVPMCREAECEKLVHFLSTIFHEIFQDGHLFDNLPQDLHLPSIKLCIPSPTASRLTENPHPLQEALGPIALTTSMALEARGDAALPALRSLLSLVSAIESSWARTTGRTRLGAFGSTSEAGPAEAADEASKRLVFAVLTLLEGPINVWTDELGFLVVKCWARIYFLVTRFGPGGFEASRRVWEGIVVGLKGVKPEKVMEIVRVLEPWAEEKGTWLRGMRATVYYSVVEVVADRLTEVYLDTKLLCHIWEELEGVELVDEKDQDRLESAHGAFLSLFVRRRRAGNVAKLAERYSDILLSEDLHERDQLRLKENQVRLALKTIVKAVTGEIGWKCVVECIAKGQDTVRAIERLLELIDAVDSHYLVSLCELIKTRVLGLRQEDEQARLIKDWFKALASSDALDQVRRIVGLRWWLDNFVTLEDGIGAKGVARL